MTQLVATKRLLAVLFLIGLAGGMAILVRSWIPATAMVPLVAMVVTL